MGCNAYAICCLLFWLFIGGLITVCVLYTNPTDPSFAIKEFYVSALNLTDNSSTTTAANQTLSFDMKIHNANRAVGAYYDPVNITFSYIPNTKLTFVVAEYTIPKFRQGNWKARHVRDTITTHGIAPFSRSTTTEYFKVEVATRVGFTSPAYRKKHTVGVVANVKVDQTGEKVGKKGITLFVAADASGVFGCFILQAVLLILSTASLQSIF